MLSARYGVLVLLAMWIPLSAVHAEESPPITNFFEGWDSFMEKRAADHAMRKMGPYLAAEWWQRVERQPLWPGRTVEYDTGIELDEDGLVALTIVMDDPATWSEIAHLLGPKGRASMPTEGTVRPGPLPPWSRIEEPGGPPATDAAASRPSSPAYRSIEEIPIQSRRLSESNESTPIQIDVDPARATTPTRVRELLKPTPHPTSSNLRSTWTVYVRAPLASVASFAQHPHVIGIFESIRGPGVHFDQGASTTEGVQTHLTRSAQQMFPAVRGQNIGVVILSDGIKNLERLKSDDSDGDRDGAPAYYDNCPRAANPDQADNGTLSGRLFDDIGDLCQCGETSGDGAIFQVDAELVRQRLVGLPSTGLVAPQRCNVFGPGATTIGAGGLPTDCDLIDVIVLKRGLAGLGPGLAQSCAPAQGL